MSLFNLTESVALRPNHWLLASEAQERSSPPFATQATAQATPATSSGNVRPARTDASPRRGTQPRSNLRTASRRLSLHPAFLSTVIEMFSGNILHRPSAIPRRRVLANRTSEAT